MSQVSEHRYYVNKSSIDCSGMKEPDKLRLGAALVRQKQGYCLMPGNAALTKKAEEFFTALVAYRLLIPATAVPELLLAEANKRADALAAASPLGMQTIRNITTGVDTSIAGYLVKKPL